MPKIVAIIAARMGSERLPGKHMHDIGGKPMIEHLIDRVRQSQKIDGIVVAIPEGAENDVLAQLCKEKNISCHRGPEDDVVARMIGALEQEKADIGVQVYGDGPLIDPAVIDELIGIYRQDDSYDLIGNDMKASYPSGCYAEVFAVQTLKEAAERTQDPAVREHGTLCMRQHPEIYKIMNIEAQGNLHRPDIHLDVDTEEDARVIEAIVDNFAPRNNFSLHEMLAFLDENPDIMKLNKNVFRRWKQYQRK
ncbi:MAG: glycosyltransferase family protein [Candidatus Peribacteraceae bacterium]|nr:glycosyltransferase family protein [Candidatus Peribacteraceae bacterium]